MSTARVRHMHRSLRFDRPWSRLLAFLSFWLRRVDVVTLTEANAYADKLRFRGWVTVQGPGDCAALVRAGWGDVRTSWSEELSEVPVVTRGGARVHALYALIEHRLGPMLLLTVAHLPADVQDGDAFSDSPKAEIWVECLRTWSRSVRETLETDGVIVVADWNVDHRRKFWRRWIGSRFPLLHCSWVDRMPPKRLGTHGRRVIDATWTSLKVRRIRVLRGFRRVSDHRGYVETLVI